MSVMFTNLFYVAYISMIVLYGSLSPSQLTQASKKSFHLFGLSILIVISLDMTGLIFGFNDHFIRDFLLYAQVICMFVILYQLKKTTLSNISICSYLFTLIALSMYSAYSIFQLFANV